MEIKHHFQWWSIACNHLNIWIGCAVELQPDDGLEMAFVEKWFEHCIAIASILCYLLVQTHFQRLVVRICTWAEYVSDGL